MRLLPVRADYERGGAAGRDSQAHGQGYRRSDGRQYMPLRNLLAHPASHSSGGGIERRTEDKMSALAMVGRREFLKTGAAVGGGLLVSWYMPLPGAGAERDAAGENQVALNAFVRIGTDESVTVIASHSEMGQGV